MHAILHDCQSCMQCKSNDSYIRSINRCSMHGSTALACMEARHPCPFWGPEYLLDSLSTGDFSGTKALPGCLRALHPRHRKCQGWQEQGREAGLALGRLAPKGEHSCLHACNTALVIFNDSTRGHKCSCVHCQSLIPSSKVVPVATGSLHNSRLTFCAPIHQAFYKLRPSML